jgi:hypothetical protein
MALYLLFESASGYGLFHAYGIDEIGQSVDAVRSSVLDLDRFGKAVKLAAFTPFSSAVDALNQCNAISEGNRRSLRLMMQSYSETACFDKFFRHFFCGRDYDRRTEELPGAEPAQAQGGEEGQVQPWCRGA